MYEAAQHEKKESEFYEIAKKAVEKEFNILGYKSNLIILGCKRKIPEEFLRYDQILMKHNPGLPVPDMIGFVWGEKTKNNKKLVVIEFKLKPRFWDIFQLKGYAEVFNADLALLLSREHMYDSSRKVLDYIGCRREILKFNGGNGVIPVMALSELDNGDVVLVRLVPEVGCLPELRDALDCLLYYSRPH